MMNAYNMMMTTTASSNEEVSFDANTSPSSPLLLTQDFLPTPEKIDQSVICANIIHNNNLPEGGKKDGIPSKLFAPNLFSPKECIWSSFIWLEKSEERDYDELQENNDDLDNNLE